MGKYTYLKIITSLKGLGSIIYSRLLLLWVLGNKNLSINLFTLDLIDIKRFKHQRKFLRYRRLTTVRDLVSIEIVLFTYNYIMSPLGMEFS